MNDLIKALQIFALYIGDISHPTNCSHDMLFVDCMPELVTQEHIDELDKLGFMPDEDYCGFISYRFGSC